MALPGRRYTPSRPRRMDIFPATKLSSGSRWKLQQSVTGSESNYLQLASPLPQNQVDGPRTEVRGPKLWLLGLVSIQQSR